MVAMAADLKRRYLQTQLLLLILILFISTSSSSLSPNYYGRSCPPLLRIVRDNMVAALRNDTSLAASLLRLHFHDCIVDGCEGSVLLDDTEDMKGEKNALPNKNSLRGFEVIDNIKSDLEISCPSTVSCTDILTLAARDAVYLSGAPYFSVLLGRRDGTTASEESANNQIPSPFESLDDIIEKFTSKGLDDLRDVVALSGAHTIGFAQCFTFQRRLFDYQGTGKPDPTLDSSLGSRLQKRCPSQDTSNFAPLDYTTIYRFDNAYYYNLLNNRGLLESDQALATDPRTASLVNSYYNDRKLFYSDFAVAFTRLTTVGVMTGQRGQVREKCWSVNY